MIKRFFWLFLLAIVLALGVGGWWARRQLVGSLPQLEGTFTLDGLAAPVLVQRDALGIPTIRAATRVDVARATGFLHAQDRFFQMDLSRRRAAGELAALVGRAAVQADREIRIHRLRAVASRAIRLLSPGDRATLDGYVAGVNAGLRALRTSPFEYLLLGRTPEPWTAEDSLLVVLTMFSTLQDADGDYETTLATLHDLLPAEAFDFFAPRGTSWDTPLVGPRLDVAPIPPPHTFNPRAARQGRPTRLPTPPPQVSSGFAPEHAGSADAPLVGSNSFAVAGTLADDGGALLANDMHLSIRVPGVWYRAAFEWPGGRSAPPHRLIGVTLPGVPAMVVGSNTHIAWGFTNSYGDWSDVVLLEEAPGDQNRYRTPAGFKPFDRFDEVIRVAGEPDEHLVVSWSAWGPVIGRDHRGRLRGVRWVAHDPAMLAASLTPLEEADTLEAAFDSAQGSGTPAQNLLVADAQGRIGWTIYGSIPRRVGLDGRLPADWANGPTWDGYLAHSDYPRLIDPPNGRLWTANARVVDGVALRVIGDGSYEVGSRARIIHDRLEGQSRFSARDLLAIQLDASATFLERWRQLLLETLTPAVVAADPRRGQLRVIVERDWDGRATPASGGYRFTRLFRDRVSQWVFAFALADCYEADDRFNYNTERKREGPLWELVTAQPEHLLDPHYRTWPQFLVAALDAVIADTEHQFGSDLGKRTWAELNVTAYRHPLSGAIPLFGRFLDMPAHELPGDLYTPRMAWGAHGASERMVVSPGREDRGIMQMPTGQSGHPLSPHYSDSHDAWVKGEPTPFLPGPAVHTLTLAPSQAR